MQNKPIYHGKRNFLGKRDLVVSFYTKKCQFSCSFCSLPLRSSDIDVSVESIVSQIDWIFKHYDSELSSFTQFSAGNEGSILDSNRFHPEAMNYLLNRLKEIPALEVLSLETRPEYISAKNISDAQRNLPTTQLDVTIGFETQDDQLRNEVLLKKISRRLFEDKVRLLGELNASLTAYVMLKPSPYMNELQGVSEAKATIDYLMDICSKSSTQLCIYLNPTYVARESPLAKQMKATGYTPPLYESIADAALHSRNLGLPTYIGLWSEGLANVDSSNASRNNKHIFDALKQFNKTQDASGLQHAVQQRKA